MSALAMTIVSAQTLPIGVTVKEVYIIKTEKYQQTQTRQYILMMKKPIIITAAYMVFV